MCVIINPQIGFIQLSHLVTFYLVTLETIHWLTPRLLGTLCPTSLHVPILPSSLHIPAGNEAIVPSPIILSAVSQLVILWHVGLRVCQPLALLCLPGSVFIPWAKSSTLWLRHRAWHRGRLSICWKNDKGVNLWPFFCCRLYPPAPPPTRCPHQP